MNAEPIEQPQEEAPPPRRPKPVIIKPRTRSTGVRLVGCPAWPTTGIYAGASVEWCREARGKMAVCASCQWRKV
ncbi:MAG: hypothetical protein ACOY3Z_06335 [Thermodesulfobacteriota bacterium]